jgi:hypothetical protein
MNTEAIPHQVSAHNPGLRSTLILAAIWIPLTFIRFLFYHTINDELWVGSLLLDGFLLILALVIVVTGLIAARHRTGRLRCLAIVLVVAGLAALMWTTPTGKVAATYFRLWQNESTYQEIVNQLTDDPAAEVAARTEVDPGPPLRIAFSWGGIIDNWHGIVHDPSGEVLKARQFKSDWSNWDDPELRPIKYLFGGDMRSARHLWGHWYYCTFT